MMSVLLAKSLAAKGYSVLLVDADESNLGLQRMLGTSDTPKPLMDYLGGKPALQQKMMAAFSKKSTEPKMEILPGEQIRLADIPPDYVVKVDSIQVVRIGKIEHTLEGCACPMGALARDFLTKLALGEREVVVTDHEAGIEHFGRGVEQGVDTVLVIVDPSFESALLAEKISRLATEVGARVVVTLNRVTPEVRDALVALLAERGISVDGSVGYDPTVFEACLTGQPLRGVQAEKEVAALVGVLGL